MATSIAVSVIVPTYNRATLLLTALRSIAAQSFQDLELIVVDDGSTDRTRELVSALGNPKIRYFYQENRGAAAARNLGIKRSRGEFVAFLDSDDCWLEAKLERQVDLLQTQRSPGCVTGYFLHTLRGRRMAVVPSAEATSLRGILWKNTLQPCTTFACRRSVFRQVGGFDETLRRGQDTDWLIRYRRTYEIGIVPEILAVFNHHLTRCGETMERSSLYFLEKHGAALLAQGSLFFRRKTAHVYQELAYQFSREGNTRKAYQYTRMSLASYPILGPGVWLLLIDSFLGTRLKRTLDSVRYPGVFK